MQDLTMHTPAGPRSLRALATPISGETSRDRSNLNAYGSLNADFEFATNYSKFKRKDASQKSVVEPSPEPRVNMPMTATTVHDGEDSKGMFYSTEGAEAPTVQQDDMFEAGGDTARFQATVFL